MFRFSIRKLDDRPGLVELDRLGIHEEQEADRDDGARNRRASRPRMPVAADTACDSDWIVSEEVVYVWDLPLSNPNRSAPQMVEIVFGVAPLWVEDAAEAPVVRH